MGTDSATFDMAGDTLSLDWEAAFDDTDVVVRERLTPDEIAVELGQDTSRATRRACTEAEWPPEPPPPHVQLRRRKAVYAVVDLIEI
jgi:hypothetical protein